VPISKKWGSETMEAKEIHPLEMMIVAISRLLKNGETVATGTLSPVPAAGCLLACSTHGPEIVPVIYGDPESRISEGLFELFGLAQKGKVDVFFLSGIQIDQQGNINLSVIGDYAKPSLRLPGGAGSNMLYALCRRTIIFSMNHTRRLFVPMVDFVNATAYDEGFVSPWRRGGMSHAVTPLCIMRFDGDRKRIVLDCLLPGVSVDRVAENTGFDLGIEGREIPEMAPPTDLEMALLRTEVRDRMRPIYPLFVEMLWS
jgi:glutaconate CoA-transferase subunit B